MRARRLIAAASVAALGLVSLAACGRSAPDVAVYVGDTTYSMSRVDEIYDDAQRTFGEAVRAQAARTGATPSPDQLRAPVTRQDVVNLLVSIDLGKRVAAAKSISVRDQVGPEDLQQPLRVPAAAEYAKLWGEWVDISQALGERLPPGELSDDSVMAVYRALEKTGQIDSGLEVAQVRRLFGDGGFVRSGAAVSAALQEEAERADLSVNPRFNPLEVPSLVGNGQALIVYSLPYIDEDGPVTDVSTPQPAGASGPADS
ncbi:hypothetical protein ACWENR_19740 [Micromonospora sp. NPDC004336]